jgi:hypothetical protein
MDVLMDEFLHRYHQSKKEGGAYNVNEIHPSCYGQSEI